MADERGKLVVPRANLRLPSASPNCSHMESKLESLRASPMRPERTFVRYTSVISWSSSGIFNCGILDHIKRLGEQRTR